MNELTLLEYLQSRPEYFSIKEKSIKIPLKTHKVVNYIPIKLLRSIDLDIDLAKEKCLIMLSFIIRTGITNWKLDNIFKNGTPKGTPLYSQLLKNTFGKGYKRILEALEEGTNKGPIIIQTQVFNKDSGKSNHYSLTDLYFGSQTYKLKHLEAINIYNNYRLNLLSNITVDNRIKKELEMMSKYTIPTKEEILKEANRIIKNNGRKSINHPDVELVSKGKLLTFKRTRNKLDWKDLEDRSFVEDSLEIFDYLFSDNYNFMPITSYQGRLVTALNLCPKWIRKLFKVEGEFLIESDYSCLYPNIAVKLYGNGEDYKYLTHQFIADELGVNVRDIKIEHLSYFNAKLGDMVNYKVHNWYLKNYPSMISRLMQDKKDNDHKIFSVKSTKIESKLQIDIINYLKYDIIIGNTFDAIWSKKSDSKRVIDIMNKVAVENGVFTSVNGEFINVNNINKKEEVKVKNKYSYKQISAFDLFDED